MQAQVPIGLLPMAFAGAYVVMTTTKQEQVPNGQFVVEGDSPTTIPQDRSMYFMVC